MRNSEKRYIPGTNPTWGRELPDRDSNSLVDKNGDNWDNGYNFDESDDDETKESTFDDLQNTKFDPEAAQKAREENQEDVNNNPEIVGK